MTYICEKCKNSTVTVIPTTDADQMPMHKCVCWHCGHQWLQTPPPTEDNMEQVRYWGGQWAQSTDPLYRAIAEQEIQELGWEVQHLYDDETGEPQLHVTYQTRIIRSQTSD